MTSELASTESANVQNIEDLVAGLEISINNFAKSKHITIHVTWDKHQSELSYTLIVDRPSCVEGDWKKTISGGPEQISIFWGKLSNILSSVVSLSNPSEEIWDSANLKLRAQGGKLFEELIHAEVKEFIRNLTPGYSIGISTNEQWIPWEVMHDGHDFLGEKFIVTRYPRCQQIDRLYKTLKSEENLLAGDSGKLKKIVNVVGGNISSVSASRAAKVFDGFESFAQVKILKEKPISTLNEVLRNADLLHFTCHGRMNPTHFLQTSKDTSLVKNLSIEDVNELNLKPGILVFTNACSSDAPEYSLNGFSSFGWAFYKKGASFFVGTIGSVPTKHAIDFSEKVYSNMLDSMSSVNTSNVMQAIVRAKQSVSNERNLFWLFYCVYGNPSFHLEVDEIQK